MTRRQALAMTAAGAAAHRLIGRPACGWAAAVDTSAGTARRVVPFVYPRMSPRSQTYKVRVGGEDVLAFQTGVGAFAAFACDGSVPVEIETPQALREVRVAPGRLGVAPTISGNTVKFVMPRPTNLFVEIEGQEPLFLFASPIDNGAPAPGARGVHRFKAGQIYEVGELRLKSNETLYIEGGAVVRGCVRATSARNVRIAGPGVLDGGYYRKGAETRRSIVLEDCRDSRIEDIIMIEPSSWMIMLGACQNVTVRNVRELGAVGSTDGVDIVGSQHIRVQDCFLRNGDDCIAVKSLDMRAHGRDATVDYTKDVEDIEVSGCSLLAYIGGTAMEIGHELRSAAIRNVRFRDCDILKKPQYGSIFGIHNADRALVSDILWENIRVEHHYDKLVDFRILESRWSKDKQRGQIRNVALRNIDVNVSAFNPGYTCSLIGGFDAQHTVEHVRFENFRLNGKAARSPDDLDLYTRHAGDITFAAS